MGCGLVGGQADITLDTPISVHVKQQHNLAQGECGLLEFVPQAAAQCRG